MKRKNITLSPLGAILSLASTSIYYPGSQQLTLWGYILLTLFAILHMGLLYFVASKLSKTQIGEFARGSMIGLNTGWNALLLFYFTGSLALSILIVLILLSSSLLRISRNQHYHRLISWLNWILPMSILVNIPGMLIFLINIFFAPFGYLHPLLHGIRLRFHWAPHCSSITIYGGLIRPMKGFAGLNMGNFIFINPGWQHLLRHEMGHLLSLAAMGSIFHYIGGIDENYLQKHYWKALAEYFAESYNSSEDSVLSMWS
ncbi:MAG: hypothetical protein R8P61_13170 [Bacteroidia bacterium]|nr:hypothetical protein [Bacteroidia bacterium]